MFLSHFFTQFKHSSPSFFCSFFPPPPPTLKHTSPPSLSHHHHLLLLLLSSAWTVINQKPFISQRGRRWKSCLENIYVQRPLPPHQCNLYLAGFWNFFFFKKKIQRAIHVCTSAFLSLSWPVSNCHLQPACGKKKKKKKKNIGNDQSEEEIPYLPKI